MTRLRKVMLVVAATCAAASCSPPTEPLNTTSGLAFVADPPSMFLSLEETTPLVVNSFPVQGVLGTVRWTSSDPRVVVVDSVVAIGAPATVRAVSAGTATLRATVSSSGNQVTLSVTVRVRTS